MATEPPMTSSQVFQLCDDLIEGRIPLADLSQALRHVTPGNLRDIAEERALQGRCGFVTCARPPRVVRLDPQATIAHRGTLVPRDHFFEFCSGECYDAFLTVLKNLNNMPPPRPVAASGKRLGEQQPVAVPTAAAVTAATIGGSESKAQGLTAAASSASVEKKATTPLSGNATSNAPQQRPQQPPQTLPSRQRSTMMIKPVVERSTPALRKAMAPRERPTVTFDAPRESAGTATTTATTMTGSNDAADNAHPRRDAKREIDRRHPEQGDDEESEDGPKTKDGALSENEEDDDADDNETENESGGEDVSQLLSFLDLSAWKGDMLEDVVPYAVVWDVMGRWITDESRRVFAHARESLMTRGAFPLPGAAAVTSPSLAAIADEAEAAQVAAILSARRVDIERNVVQGCAAVIRVESSRDAALTCMKSLVATLDVMRPSPAMCPAHWQLFVYATLHALVHGTSNASAVADDPVELPLSRSRVSAAQLADLQRLWAL